MSSITMKRNACIWRPVVAKLWYTDDVNQLWELQKYCCQQRVWWVGLRTILETIISGIYWTDAYIHTFSHPQNIKKFKSIHKSGFLQKLTIDTIVRKMYNNIARMVKQLTTLQIYQLQC